MGVKCSQARDLLPRTHLLLALALSFLLAAASGCPPPAVQKVYSLLDVGYREATAAAVSPIGEVAGSFTNDSGNYHAFYWNPEQGGTLVDIGHLGLDYSVGFGIGFYHEVVGLSNVVVANGAHLPHAFRWDSNSGMVDLGTLGGNVSVATAVNAKGEIVGYSSGQDNKLRPFLWDSTNGMQLFPGGDAGGYAFAVNEGTAAVGSSLDATHFDVGPPFPQARLWYGDGTQGNLDNTVGGNAAMARGINLLNVQIT